MNLREWWNSSGGKHTPEDFVTKPGPCENKRLFVPKIKMPEFREDEVTEGKVNAVITKLNGIVGSFGERESKMNTPEYKEAAAEFQKLTGVNYDEVVKEMQERFRLDCI